MSVGKRDPDDSPRRMFYDADAPAPAKGSWSSIMDGAATLGRAGDSAVASPLGVPLAAGVSAGSVSLDRTAVMTG